MLDGDNPYPAPNFDPTAAPNFIWPPSVAVVVSPLLLLPLAAADIVMVAVGLTCIAASLWLVGLRDWRVYGLVALWPQVTGEMRVSHLTAALASCSRSRGAPGTPRLRRGSRSEPRRLEVLRVAARRVAGCDATIRRRCARRRPRRRVVRVLVPFTPRRLLPGAPQDGRHFDQDSYTVFGFLVQSGAPETVARATSGPPRGCVTGRDLAVPSLALAIASALVARQSSGSTTSP